MERTYIKDLKDHKGEEVVIAGWVDVRRDQGKMVFMNMRDMSGKVQCVVLPSHAEALEEVKEIRTEWVLSLKGIVNERPEKNRNAGVQNGDIELEVTNIEVLSKAQELPFELGTEVNLDTYLDYLPFTLRSQKGQDIFRVQETIIQAFREALKKEEFVEFQAPAIVGGDAEGGATAFKVDYYYDKTAFLATSPQFYKQIMAGAFERVFTTPKVFRGEKHATTRHLSEYTTLDYEMSFIEDHREVMKVLENTIRAILLAVGEEQPGVFERGVLGEV